MDQQETTRRLIDGGIGDGLAAVLATLNDATTSDGSPRFSPTVTRRLGRAIACRNYATALLQLCHFVNLADAAGQGRERYEGLLFGLDRVSASAARGYLDRALKAGGWRRSGFALSADGVEISYRDGEFQVPFGRMPFLVALAEFLIGIDDYVEIDAIFQAMLEGGQDQRAIKDASNALARRLYRVLDDELPSAQSQEKFGRIVNFLSARADDQNLTIDDKAVLDFWREASTADDDSADFRTFRSALASFVALVATLRGGDDKSGIRHALRLGTDREAGEIDVDALEAVVESIDPWRSPLAALDEAPADRVKFLNKKERAYLQEVMDCGPVALELPLSVMRADTFGVTQSRITQALRRNDVPAVGQLCACGDTESYDDRIAGFRDVLAQQERVMMATLHVLQTKDTEDEPGSDADPNVVSAAALAFRRLSRAGFSEQDLDDPEVIEAYRIGASALADTKAQVVDFLEHWHEAAGPRQFEDDRASFAQQFGLLYGAAS